MSACTGTGRKVAHRKDDLNEIIEHFNVSCLLLRMLRTEHSCMFDLLSSLVASSLFVFLWSTGSK